MKSSTYNNKSTGNNPCKCGKLEKYNNSSFNTLAQVGTNLNLSCNSTIKKSGELDTLQKRARSKHISDAMINELHKLDSPIKSSYGRTLKCCYELIVKDGIATSRYCKNRFCLVCARIKTAVLCDKYADPMRTNFPDAYFVTLTTPNVEAILLKDEMARLFNLFKSLNEKHKKRYQRGKEPDKLKAIVKLECTYNSHRNDFHPHLHIITNSLDNAEYIVKEWLTRNPKSEPIAQDIRKCDEKSLMEVFKYSTKLMSDIEGYEKGKSQGKGKLVIEALDVMFRAMSKKRTLRCYGFRLKIEEEFTENDLKAITTTEADDSEYTYKICDWVDEDDTKDVTGWRPGIKEEEFKKSILVTGIKFLPKYMTRSDIIDLMESYRLDCGFRDYRHCTYYLLTHSNELRNFEDVSFKRIREMGFDDTIDSFLDKLYKYFDKVTGRLDKE